LAITQAIIGIETESETSGQAWIVEERRAQSTLKFTGTLAFENSRPNDRESNTVHAFGHFSFLISQGNCVMADIQGMLIAIHHYSKADYCVEGTRALVEDKSKLVLFDIMMHTTDG